MGTRRILVVDTGEDAQARAASEAARQLGHEVFNHASPVGVGSALAQHDADVVILVWDLPAQQDHKLLSLIESWERFRPLRTLVITVQREQELRQLLSRSPNASVLPVGEIDKGLSRALGEPSREFEAVGSQRGESSRFVIRLRNRLTDAAQCWETIAQGSENFGEMEFLLAAAQGQARLIHLEKLMVLLAHIRLVIHECEERKRPNYEQYEAIAAALSFAIFATSAPPYDADRDVQPMLERLRKSRA